MIQIGNQTIVIVKPALITDTRDNSRILSYTTGATLLTVTGCSVQPKDVQEELTTDRDFSRSYLYVWAPHTSDTTDIQPHDHIRYLDAEYEVYGQVMPWVDLQGLTNHVKFLMMLREG